MIVNKADCSTAKRILVFLSSLRQEAAEYQYICPDGQIMTGVLSSEAPIKYLQSRDGFRQDTHTSIYRRHLHGRPFSYILAGGRTTHEKDVATPGGSVLRLVSGLEQSGKDTHFTSRSFLKHQELPGVVNVLGGLVAAAYRTVESHDRDNRAVDLLR